MVLSCCISMIPEGFVYKHVRIVVFLIVDTEYIVYTAMLFQSDIRLPRPIGAILLQACVIPSKSTNPFHPMHARCWRSAVLQTYAQHLCLPSTCRDIYDISHLIRTFRFFLKGR